MRTSIPRTLPGLGSLAAGSASGAEPANADAPMELTGAQRPAVAGGINPQPLPPRAPTDRF
jgi:hypothetical protein